MNKQLDNSQLQESHHHSRAGKRPYLTTCLCVRTLSRFSCVQLSTTYGLWPARLLCPWDSPGKNTGGLPYPPPGDLPNPRIEPRSPALQMDSLPLATWEADYPGS